MAGEGHQGGAGRGGWLSQGGDRRGDCIPGASVQVGRVETALPKAPVSELLDQGGHHLTGDKDLAGGIKAGLLFCGSGPLYQLGQREGKGRLGLEASRAGDAVLLGLGPKVRPPCWEEDPRRWPSAASEPSTASTDPQLLTGRHWSRWGS